MTIRFLETAESAVPGFPFIAGQVIDIPAMTPEIRAALSSGRAELVRGEEPELAVVEAPERAAKRKGRKRVLA